MVIWVLLVLAVLLYWSAGLLVQSSIREALGEEDETR